MSYIKYGKFKGNIYPASSSLSEKIKVFRMLYRFLLLKCKLQEGTIRYCFMANMGPGNFGLGNAWLHKMLNIKE